jgi:hypothetical protein
MGESNFDSAEKREIWRGYFRAAITGYVAALSLDIRGIRLPDSVVEACGHVADAAMKEEQKRVPKGAGSAFVV